MARYTRADGTLIWRDWWPGMDGSDDGYESFHALPLLYLLGGDDDLLAIAHTEWEAITWQFTEYGQVHREFDAYYDWMHHGEANLYFYFLRLADPHHYRDRQRTLRFAAFYTGDDDTAPNYDRELRMMRSPLTGSRGPRLVVSAEDWSTHRDVLRHFPPIFEDVPTLPDEAYISPFGGGFPKIDWNDDATFTRVLELFNQRMSRGDVPLNLGAAGLVAMAYLQAGQNAHRQWIVDYLEAWAGRSRANGGIVPDNIGPSGVIGELNEGKWWGGYYGWRWPHGATTVLEPLLVAGSSALLVTGTDSQLDLLRSQLDLLWSLRRGNRPHPALPHKHQDAGWEDFRRPSANIYVHLWNVSEDVSDADRIERLFSGALPPAPDPAGGDPSAWFAFVRGLDTSDYPARALQATSDEVTSLMKRIRSDQSNPSEQYVQHWIERNPVLCGTLVELAMGSPFPLYHGGLLHCRAYYFDPVRRRPGLPRDVAALVSAVDQGGFTLQLVNTSVELPRTVIVQAGAFAEHTFLSVAVDGGTEQAINASSVAVDLQPAATMLMRFRVGRHTNDPRLQDPWPSAVPLDPIRPREPDIDPGALRFWE